MEAHWGKPVAMGGLERFTIIGRPDLFLSRGGSQAGLFSPFRRPRKSRNDPKQENPMSSVTLAGNPIDVSGRFLAPGDAAPAFSLTCAASTRKFNAEANNLPNTVVLVISADLPFAAKRFCETEGLANVKTLSTFRSPGFAQAYGVAITSGPLTGLTARAVVVLDEQDKVIHSQLVPEIKDEPDYAAALAALK